MQLVIFTLNAIVVYLVSDWLVRRIEQKRGAALKQRQAVFFVIFLVLALTSFAYLRSLFGEP
jgi:multisubunit Na+/H+ antiporter MnhB subunit